MAIKTIRAALSDAATSDIDGLNGYSYGASFMNVPAFFVADVELDYGSALESGMETAAFNCRMLVSKTDDEGGQERVDEFMTSQGDKSVKAALELDRTLAGACFEVHVDSAEGPKVYVHNGVDYLGCQFRVQVTGRGA
jgi:hypothetical protein